VLRQKERKKPKADPEQIQSSKERIDSLKTSIKTIAPGEDYTGDGKDEDKEDQGQEIEAVGLQEADDEEVFQSDEAILLRKEQDSYVGLFSYCHFWLSREVPRESLEFVIKSFGGRVSWDGNGKETDQSITHHIADRPLIENIVSTRNYVQPQWVYDSVNNIILLPVHEYAPGGSLPPHLSPFVDDYNIGYVPEYRKKLDQYYFEQTGIRREREIAPLIEEQVETPNEEEEYEKELAKEQAGKYDDKEEEEAEQKPQKPGKPVPRKKTDEENQAEMALSLLSGNQRRLLRPFRRRIQNRNRYIQNLTRRNKLLTEGKAKIENNTFVVDPELKPKPKKKKESMYHLPWWHPAFRGTRRRRTVPYRSNNRPISKPQYYPKGKRTFE